MSRFLNIYTSYSLVETLPMSTFFAEKIKRCGRIIHVTGVKIDHINYEGVKNAAELSKADEVCTNVHCAAWISNAISHLAKCAASLYAFLEAVYIKAGIRSKREIACLSLKSFKLDDEHTKTF